MKSPRPIIGDHPRRTWRFQLSGLYFVSTNKGRPDVFSPAAFYQQVPADRIPDSVARKEPRLAERSWAALASPGRSLAGGRELLSSEKQCLTSDCRLVRRGA